MKILNEIRLSTDEQVQIWSIYDTYLHVSVLYFIN